MKKMKVLFGVLVAALSTFGVQNVYAVDDFSVAYTVTEPVAGATIPQTVEATFTAPGEEPAAQTLNLFWYEVNGYGSTYKKVDYSTFKVGRTYRPSVVDVNFTSTTYSHNGYSYEVPGNAISNCTLVGGGNSVETGSSHLSNAFRCNMSLVETVNGETGKTFTLPTETISEINIRINTEIAGTEAERGEEFDCGEEEKCYTAKTFATVTLGDNYTIGDSGKAYYISSFPSEGEGYDKPFFGTFEEGKEYYVETYLVPDKGYEFAENPVIKVNGQTTGFEVGEWSSPSGIILYSKIKATKKVETPATTTETTSGATTTAEETVKATLTSSTTEVKQLEVLDGNSQEYDATSNKPLKFRFNVDYNEFKKSGKVFVDGKLTDSSNYDSSEGSTIITFKKAFTDKLAAGKHTVKLTVDGAESNGTFVVTKAVKNPKTGDSINKVMASFVISLISLISLAIYTKKKAFN